MRRASNRTRRRWCFIQVCCRRWCRLNACNALHLRFRHLPVPTPARSAHPPTHISHRCASLPPPLVFTADYCSSTHLSMLPLLPQDYARSDASVFHADGSQSTPAPKGKPQLNKAKAVPGQTARNATLAAAFGVSNCCSCLGTALIFSILYNSGVFGSTGGSDSLPPAAPPAPPLTAVNGSVNLLRSCAAYRTDPTLFEGLEQTMTANGLVEASGATNDLTSGATDGDGGAIAPLSFENPFAGTFFNFSCLAENGTGDPCDGQPFRLGLG